MSSEDACRPDGILTSNDAGAHRVAVFSRSSLLVLLLFSTVAMTMSLVSQSRDDQYSPLDEISHVAYAYEAGYFRLPYAGSTYSQFIADDWACRRQPNLQKKLPDCNDHTPVAEFPLKGLQYNAFHPPLYYFVTGVGARAVDLVVPGWNFVPLVRTLGAVWLIAAMWWLYLLLLGWGVRRSVAICSGLVLTAIPFLLHAARIGSNDATAALGGVAAIYVAARVFRSRRLGWVVPGVLAALVAATKTMNSVPLIALGLVLVVVGARERFGRTAASGSGPDPRAGPRPGPDSNSGSDSNSDAGSDPESASTASAATVTERQHGTALIRIGLSIGAASAAVYLIWAAIQAARAEPGYRTPIRSRSAKLEFDGLPFDEWFRYAFDGFNLTGDYYLHPFMRSLLYGGWIVLFAALTSAAVFIGIALFRNRSAERLLSFALLVGCLLYPMFVQLRRLTQTEGMEYFPNYTTRYGLSLVPLAVAILAIAVNDRRALRRSWQVITVAGPALALATVFGWLAT